MLKTVKSNRLIFETVSFQTGAGWEVERFNRKPFCTRLFSKKLLNKLESFILIVKQFQKLKRRVACFGFKKRLILLIFIFVSKMHLIEFISRGNFEL